MSKKQEPPQGQGVVYLFLMMFAMVVTSGIIIMNQNNPLPTDEINNTSNYTIGKTIIYENVTLKGGNDTYEK